MSRKILVSACLLGICCRYDGKGNPKEAVLSLLDRDDITLIPVCPEQLGGLTTPRIPSERQGDDVINRAGEHVTLQFVRGAEAALSVAKLYGCNTAILKERSPSCGCGTIYDGSFSGRLIDGDGMTAELLRREGIAVYGESRIKEIFD